MTKTLKMTFNLEGGKTATVSLASPKEDIKAADVQALMDMMVSKEALIVKNNKVSSAKEAVIRAVEETKLF